LPIAVHVRGDPERFATRLREIATTIDPALRVMTPQPLPHVLDPEIQLGSFVYRLFATLTVIAMVPSLSGRYAGMAFAVAKRAGEIGVRVALGASPRQIIGAVFKRPLMQIGGGLAVGTIPGSWCAHKRAASADSDSRMACGARCARDRGLCGRVHGANPSRVRIQPTEALKHEG
jgi:hypothetical protein